MPIPQAIETLKFLHPGGEPFELCVIGPKDPKSTLWEGYAGGGKKAIVGGWFQDQEAAAKLAVKIPAVGIYVTLNPCKEALLARADHPLIAGVNRTKDQEIEKIKNLLIDLDPIRPEGISSTDQEHEAALEMAGIILADLTKEGWPEPMSSDSGNGGHLIYALDLPRNDESVAVVKAVLQALNLRHADQLRIRNLEIDQSVFNPARLTNLYGTRVRKGDNTQDRPHRLAQILSLPEARRPVPIDLLKKLADSYWPQEKTQSKPAKADGLLDVEAYLSRYGVEVGKVKPHGGGLLFCLKKCVFDPSHLDNEAAIGRAANGKLFYQCFHNSCRERTWAEARAVISGQDKLNEFIIDGFEAGMKESGELPQKEPLSLPQADRNYIPPWPGPVARDAYHGLAGDFVKAIEPHTEADPVALLGQFLSYFGNVIGPPGPYYQVEGDYHHLKLFLNLVGDTSKARKGTSHGHIQNIYRQVDLQWTKTRIVGGLSSGEGLIWGVRDPITKQEPVKDKGKHTGEYRKVEIDPGEADKRLLVYEPEFATVLKVMGREGSTLSDVIRKAWDGTDLRTLTKNTPAKATGTHISIIGHITAEELRRYLDKTEMANGLGNRFIWLCVKRSKILPHGGLIETVNFSSLIERLAGAVDFARKAGRITMAPDTAEIWEAVYGPLSEGKPGLTGALIARGEAQVVRLASIYALLDQSILILPEHLQAAMALWTYAEASVRFIFGNALGDPVADQINRALKTAIKGLTRTEISNLLGRNVQAGRIGVALDLLHRHHLARVEHITDTGGRAAERWFYVTN